MAEAQSSTAIISPSLVQPLSSPNRAELENRPNPIVEIAASGDIILVVGPKQVRLCVYSQILKTVSKPFSAMLSPTWNPGCSLPSATSPVEYFLPEDDADAMKYVCAVLHHQNHILPRPMETCDIFQISVIADKYDLLGALEFASESWLADRDGSCVCDWELTRLAAAAYTFQDAEAFKDTTRALVLNYSGSFLDIADKELKSAMGLEVFFLLEEQRNTARLELGDELLKMICNQKPKQRRGRYRKTYCPCLEEHACKNLEWLKTHGLWPSDLDSISEAMNRAENLPKVIAKNRVCSYRAVKFTMEEHGIDENGVERWARIQNARLGLCLPCIRAGKMSPAYCYIKH